MKHVNTLKKGLFLLGAIACMFTVKAQNARFQLIHNAADPILDTVDIYVNGSKVDNVAFRTASSLLATNAGVLRININDKSSSDSGDQVLVRFTPTLAANSNTIFMVSGVANPSNFAANPNSANTGVSLFARTVANFTAGTGKTQATFLHGITDAPAVDIIARKGPTGGNMPSNLGYGQVTSIPAIFFDNVETYFEARVAGTRNVIKGYKAGLSSFNQQAITVFASGFVNPAANQNGKPLALFAADTNGNVVMLPEAARVQFIHNSPDTAVKSVDIYMNNNKVVSNLAFRAASSFLTSDAGDLSVRIANVNSTDTIFYIPSVNIVSGKSYVAIANGLKDTSMYAPNPNGLDRSFTIDGLDSILEGSTVANRFQYVVYNGSPNSVNISLNKLPSNSSFVSGLAYGDFSNLLSDNANFVFNVSNTNKTEYNGAYTFRASGSDLNQTGVVFTSGFYSANGNPAGAPSFKILVALNDGTVRELSRLSNKLQVIHNSPDTTIRSVDVYANGVKFISGLKFRNATGITATDAYVPVRLNITKAGALDTANSLWAASLLPDSNFNIAIAHGFTGTAYRPNPNGVATNFDVTLVSPAKSSSTLPSPTNEVSFFHGSPNMGKVTIQGEQEGLFIARDNAYRSLYKYSPTKGNAAAQYFITNVIATGSPVSTYKANFVGRSGLAGIMFSSGISLNITIGSTTRTFYDSAQKKNVTIKSFVAWNKADSALFAADSNLRLGYYIAWSDGRVDTLERVRENVGVNELNTKNSAFVMYPNPATDKVTVAFTASQKQSLNVNIMDIRGALVKTVNVMPVLGENKVEIETGDLTKGIYFIQLNGLAGFTTQKLIIE